METSEGAKQSETAPKVVEANTVKSNASPHRADGKIRIPRGATLSFTGEIDDRIATQLSMSESEREALPNLIGDAIDRRREAMGSNAFTMTRRSIENRNGNVIVTLQLVANHNGDPYRIVLLAVQGDQTWARTIERGRGNERPGYEHLSAGDEGPMMTLSQRLATSLIADSRDLGDEFVREAMGD